MIRWTLFCGRDTITSLAGLNETSAPDGFEFKKSNNHSLFYDLVFDEETKLDESTKGQFLKPKERPPYSVEMIRHICVIHRSRRTSNYAKNFHYHQFRY